MKQTIVGAGISGLSCAIQLENLGLNTCLIEKNKESHKLCGGLLTYKAYKELEKITDSTSLLGAIETTTKDVEIIAKNGKKWDVQMRNPMYIIDKTKLIKLLRANEYKGELIYTENYKIHENDINAAGLNNTYNKCLGFKLNSDNKKCFGLQIDIYNWDYRQQNITIEFSNKFKGYYWKFPLKTGIRVGMGSDYTNAKERIEYLSLFTEYLDKNGYKYKMQDIKGGFLPNGPCEYIENTIGDACGMVNCLTGEGMYYSIKQGILLANLIYWKRKFNNLSIETLQDHYCKEEQKVEYYKKSLNQLKNLQQNSYLIKKLFYSKLGQIIFPICSKKFIENFVNFVNEKF